MHLIRQRVMVLAAFIAGAFAMSTMAQELPGLKPGLRPGDWKVPGSASEKKAQDLVKVMATADADVIAPGQKFLLAFVFQIEPGWHVYWKNSGASGAPTEVKVSAPPQFAVGRTLFPRPKAFSEPEGTVYGYEGQTVLFVEVTAPVVAAATSAVFRAELDWLVCKDICKVGNIATMVAIPVSESASPNAQEKDETIERFRKRLPHTMTNGQDGAAIEIKDGVLRAELPAQGRTTAEFFPNETPGIVYGFAQSKVEGDRMIVTVPVTINTGNAGGKSILVNGLVALGSSLDDPCFEFEFPLPAP